MPEPNPNESEKDFVDRCIPVVLKEGTAKDGSQANAICHSMYEQHQKKQEDAKVVEGFESPEPGNLPEPGAKILAEVYATCRKEHPDYPKSRCSEISWGAVHKSYMQSGENWIKKDSLFDGTNIYLDRLEFDSIKKKIKKDYITYPGRVITKVGVMNGRFKSPESIKNAKYPEFVPIYADHIHVQNHKTLKDYLVAIYKREVEGFINNIQTIGTDEKTIIVGDYNYFRYNNKNDLNKFIDDKGTIEESIEYFGDTKKVPEQEFDSVKYDKLDENLYITGVCHMVDEVPSCSVEDGCGQPVEEVMQDSKIPSHLVICRCSDCKAEAEIPKSDNPIKCTICGGVMTDKKDEIKQEDKKPETLNQDSVLNQDCKEKMEKAMTDLKLKEDSLKQLEDKVKLMQPIYEDHLQKRAAEIKTKRDYINNSIVKDQLPMKADSMCDKEVDGYYNIVKVYEDKLKTMEAKKEPETLNQDSIGAKPGHKELEPDKMDSWSKDNPNNWRYVKEDKKTKGSD